MSEYTRSYYAKNKETINAKRRANHVSNPVKRKEYYDNNREKINATRRACRKRNTPRVNNKAMRERGRRFYAFISQVKLLHGCMSPNCGWCNAYTSEMLDFHHIDAKTHCVSQMRSRGRAKVVVEINKCIVLCTNCHRMHHAGNLDLTTIDKCCIDESGCKVTT